MTLTNGNLGERLKVKYIANKPSAIFREGQEYTAYRIKDNGFLLGFFLDCMDEEPGYYGFPAQNFEELK